jgi:hypothetical protein
LQYVLAVAHAALPSERHPPSKSGNLCGVFCDRYIYEAIELAAMLRMLPERCYMPSRQPKPRQQAAIASNRDQVAAQANQVKSTRPSISTRPSQGRVFNQYAYFQYVTAIVIMIRDGIRS